MFYNTRQEAVANQKNKVIRAALERMSDAQYAAHIVKQKAMFATAEFSATISAMASDLAAK
jgi:hypothetical protein